MTGLPSLTPPPSVSVNGVTAPPMPPAISVKGVQAPAPAPAPVSEYKVMDSADEPEKAFPKWGIALIVIFIILLMAAAGFAFYKMKVSKKNVGQ